VQLSLLSNGYVINDHGWVIADAVTHSIIEGALGAIFSAGSERRPPDAIIELMEADAV
jgi:hypothetical protein